MGLNIFDARWKCTVFIVVGLLMSVVSLRGVCVGFGGPLVLDHVDLNVERGERVCLVGRNGAGKSTIMKVLMGQSDIKDGEIVKEAGVQLAMLGQEVIGDEMHTVVDEVLAGLGRIGELAAEYEHASAKLANGGGDDELKKLERVQHELESAGGWGIHQKVEVVLGHLKLDGEAKFGSLSAGTKRRVELAKALVVEPDVLLLDEPTNHLDIDSICWLEEFLLKFKGTIIFVTHDRQFMRKMATRIVDVDRGNVTSWQCDYDTYVKRKEQRLGAEAQEWDKFDKRLAEEEVWIRGGIKARRRRNEGRVRELMKMRQERSDRKQRRGSVKVSAQDIRQSGRLVIEALGVKFAFGDDVIIDGFDTTILRGDKVGVIGPNGSGKTTLLKVLLGELKEQDGRIRLGENLEISYFDQLHKQLDEEKTVWGNVGEGYDTVEINGQKKHVIGYLQDFLFTPTESKKLVRYLSGGERNRVLLAKMFAKPANVMVLDEPTNDLDMETLELLEEMLVGYAGTVLLVSHDRTFLNNVVTSTLVLEGAGKVKEYAGGYDDWLRQRAVDEPVVEKKAKVAKPVRKKAEGKRKLSYRERQELEELPAKIEMLEGEVGAMHEAMGSADYYKQDAAVIAAAAKKNEELENELTILYARWEELEAIEG